MINFTYRGTLKSVKPCDDVLSGLLYSMLQIHCFPLIHLRKKDEIHNICINIWVHSFFQFAFQKVHLHFLPRFNALFTNALYMQVENISSYYQTCLHWQLVSTCYKNLPRIQVKTPTIYSAYLDLATNNALYCHLTNGCWLKVKDTCLPDEHWASAAY